MKHAAINPTDDKVLRVPIGRTSNDTYWVNLKLIGDYKFHREEVEFINMGKRYGELIPIETILWA
jgi:hypothetical protein